MSNRHGGGAGPGAGDNGGNPHNGGSNTAGQYSGTVSVTQNDSQVIQVTDVISEGPIYGLVDGAASVFMNNDRVIEPSSASQHLSRGVTTITLTNGQTGAVINNSLSTNPITLNEEAGGSLNLIIREGFTGPSGQLVTSDWLSRHKQVLTTSSSFFTSSMITTSAGRTNPDQLVPARLVAISGSSTTPDGIPIEGFLHARDSGTKARWRTGHFGDYNDYEITDGNYTLHLDRIVAVAAVSGVNVTLAATWAGATGTYAFDNTGIINLTSTPAQALASQRVQGAAVSFRPGTLNQTPMGSGGSSAITVNFSGLSMEHTTGYGGDQAPRVLLASGNLALTAEQRIECDKVKFRINYPGGFKSINGKGDDRAAGIFYDIKVAIKQEGESSFEAYRTINSALKHTGKREDSVTFEHSIDLRALKPFIDFRIQINRKSSHENPGYDSFGQRPSDDWTNVTTGSVHSATCILDEKLNHPYTAMAEVEFSSKQFTGLPQRTYDVKGKLIQVPSNYVTRDEAVNGVATYNRNTSTGAIENTYQDWDGAFRTSLVYTNNPAWVYYDIVTNNRYGLGTFIKDTDIDKYALYRVARYCDTLVTDGKGGEEPRYTLNTYLTKQADSYKVLKDLATNFLGLLYFLDGKLYTSIDAPASPVYNFTKANVLEGAFSYETTGSKTRANQVIVSWNDPDKNYALQPLLVEDKRNISSTGRIIKESAVAYGCTSESQALRYGRWKLWTSANQKEVVSFQTGINGGFITPGDVINVQDSDRYAVRLGGRISTTGTISTTVVPLDSSVALLTGSTYTLAVVFVKPSAFTLQDAYINGTFYKAGSLVTSAFVDSNNNGTYTYQTIDTPEEAANAKGSATVTDALVLEWKDHLRTEAQPVSSSLIGQTRTSLTVSTAFTSAPTAEDIWVLTEEKNSLNVQGSAKEYRVLSIAQSDKNEYDITAVEHYDSKYDSVEEDFTTYVQTELEPSVRSTDIVPPVTALSAKSALRASGSANDTLVLSWNTPENEEIDGDVVNGVQTSYYRNYGRHSSQSQSNTYEYLLGFMIDHDIPNYPSPITLNRHITGFNFDDIDPGDYTIAVRTRNILDNLSSSTSIQATVTDRFTDVLPRMALGAPYGGSCSTTTKISNAGLFELVDSTYGFRPAQSNGAILANASTTGNTFQLDISDMPIISAPNTSALAGTFIADHHYVTMRSNTSTNILKLLKYVKPTFNVPYWIDAGTGSNATGLTNLTGTLQASTQSKLTGTSTAFSTELAAGALVKIGTTAAIVSSIVSDTVLYLDRIITVANNATAQTNNYRFDYQNETIIAKVYKTASQVYYNNTYMSLDSTLVPQRGVARTLYQLKTSGGAADSVPTTGTFANPEAGQTAWTLAIPNITANNDKIYATTRVFTSDGKDPQSSTWSAATLIAHRQDGTNGGAGSNNATVSLYRVSTNGSSAPTAFAGTFTYTFDTAAISSGTLNSWTTAIPTVPQGSYLWIRQASASSITNTVTIAHSAFSPAVVVSASGIDGAISKVVSLRASKDIIEYSAAGAHASSQTITVTADSTNFTNAYFKFTATGSTFTDETSWTDGSAANTDTATYNIPTTYSATPVTFTVEVKEGASGSVIATDTLTIASIKPGVTPDTPDDGIDALTVILTNEAHTLPVDTSGGVTYTGSGTSIRVFEGVTELDHDNTGTALSHYKVITTGSTDITPGSLTGEAANVLSATFGAHSSITAATALVKYTITGKRAGGTAFTIIKYQSLSKSVAGVPGTAANDEKTVIIYRKQSTAADVTFDSGYNATHQTHSNPTLRLDGWGTSLPALVSNGDKIYAASRTFTLTSNSGGWSSPPVLIAQKTDGDDSTVPGPAGLRTIQGYLYYEKTTANNPPTPEVDVYNFSSGIITNNTSSNSSRVHDGGTTNVWKNSPNIQDATSPNTYYTVRYYGTETSASSANITVTYGSIVQHTSFTGVVTFNSGTLTDGNSANDITPIEASGVAAAVNANSTTINGGKITAGSTIEVGTITDNKAGLTGVGTDATSVRIYSGADFADRDEAPFNVTQDGEFTSSTGNIGGFTFGTDAMTSTASVVGTVLRLGSTTAIGESVTLSSRPIDDYVLYAGYAPSDNQAVEVSNNPPFGVQKNGNVTMRSFELRDTAGTVLLDSDNLLGPTLLSQIDSHLGTPGTPTVSLTLPAENGGVSYANELELEIGSTQNITLDFEIPTGNMYVAGLGSPAIALANIPHGIKVTVEYKASTSSTWSAFGSQQFTAIANSNPNPPSLNSSQYWIQSESYTTRSSITQYRSEVVQGVGCITSTGNLKGVIQKTNLAAGTYDIRISSSTTGTTRGITYTPRTTTTYTGADSNDNGYGYYSGGAQTAANGHLRFANRSITISSAAGSSGTVGPGFNLNTTVVPAEVKDASYSTTYLPLAGGTLTGDTSIHALSNPTLTLKNTDPSIVANQVIGTVEFRGADDDGNILAGHIQQVASGTWGSSAYDSDMVFSTKTGGSGGSFTEKLRLGATGITIPNKIMHTGDTDTHIEFATDRINFIAGNATMMSLVEDATGYDFVKMGTGSNTVTVNLADGSLTASGNITAYSDITLKENIEVIDNALDKVCAIRGVTYNRKDKDISDRQAGVIAQEIEKVLPEVVVTDENGIKAVAYGNVVGLLVEAIKELKDEIEELKRSK